MRILRLTAALGATMDASRLGKSMHVRACSGSVSHSSAGLLIEQFPCLRDNYGFLVHDEATGATAAIDTPEVGPILDALDRRGWKLTHILNTHHHFDHAGGNAELVRRTGCKVVAPAAEAAKIGHVDMGVAGGDRFELGDSYCMVLDVGGHTKGQVAYHFVDAYAAFVGDSLFALGCGRLFEGPPEQVSPQQTVPAYLAHWYKPDRR
jgi:hydroxyacylglutathione hydrolase